MASKAAIYHFTNKSNQRPKIYKEQLKTLCKYAESVGFKVVDVFCDKSLRMYERTEFERLLSSSEQYDALITKDFYHIAKNTGKCMEIMKELLEKGLTVCSFENGVFTLEIAPFEKFLRAVTYTSHFGSENEMREVIPVRNDIFNLFISKKTNWTVIDQYYDKSIRQRDCEQVQMKELISNRDKYDVLLVHNMNDIHWRTANFCKIREQLQLDIYSLQEGFLKYRRNK